jgi:hypothetical protein
MTKTLPNHGGKRENAHQIITVNVIIGHLNTKKKIHGNHEISSNILSVI